MPDIRAAEMYRANLHDFWDSEVYEAAKDWQTETDCMVESSVYILSKLNLVNEQAGQTITYTNGLVVN